jgi:hypothetical protein
MVFGGQGFAFGKRSETQTGGRESRAHLSQTLIGCEQGAVRKEKIIFNMVDTGRY